MLRRSCNSAALHAHTTLFLHVTIQYGIRKSTMCGVRLRLTMPYFTQAQEQIQGALKEVGLL